jgi:hypothetical protein
MCDFFGYAIPSSKTIGEKAAFLHENLLFFFTLYKECSYNLRVEKIAIFFVINEVYI